MAAAVRETANPSVDRWDHAAFGDSTSPAKPNARKTRFLAIVDLPMGVFDDSEPKQAQDTSFPRARLTAMTVVNKMSKLVESPAAALAVTSGTRRTDTASSANGTAK